MANLTRAGSPCLGFLILDAAAYATGWAVGNLIGWVWNRLDG